MATKKKAVVLISGGGSNLAALLAAHEDGAYPLRVIGVVSDRADAGGLQLARDAGVATAVVAPRDFPDRAAWDRGVTAAVAAFDPDLVISAGFMRVLGQAFLDRFEGRTINTHPALLPAFPGAHAVRDALAAGATETGCTVHLIDAGVDTGPVLAQARIAIVPGESEDALHERIKQVERPLLVRTAAEFAAGRLGGCFSRPDRSETPPPTP